MTDTDQKPPEPAQPDQTQDDPAKTAAEVEQQYQARQLYNADHPYGDGTHGTAQGDPLKRLGAERRYGE